VSQGKKEEVVFKRKKTKNNPHQILQRIMQKNSEARVCRVNCPTLSIPGVRIQIKQRYIFCGDDPLEQVLPEGRQNFSRSAGMEQTSFLIQWDQGKQRCQTLVLGEWCWSGNTS